MKKQMKQVMYILLAISMITCIVVGTKRIGIENAYKQVEIAIRYSDVLHIAMQTDLSVEEVLKGLKEEGATTLFVRENTIAPIGRGEFYNFKEQGLAQYYDGYELQRQYPESSQIKRQLYYIETYSNDAFNSIYKHLKAKDIPMDVLTLGDRTYIELKAHPSILTTIGVGFNHEDLEIAAKLGYIISPQIKSWDSENEEGIELLIDEMNKIQNLGTIYFADSDIKLFNAPQVQELVKKQGLGFVEFFSNKQKGFGALAKAASSYGTDFNVVRLHTVNDNEISKYTVGELMNRYTLALTERNLRTFLFKMPSTMDVKEDAEYLVDAISTFNHELTAKGYTTDEPIKGFNLPLSNYLIALLAGLGAISVFILIFDRLGILKIGYLLAALGLVGYAALLRLSPTFGLKMMALFGAIVFPTYGVVCVIQREALGLKGAILGLLKASVISFGGALTIIGTLSRTSFALGIDVFAGVKLAHLMPILLIIGMILYKYHGLNYNYMQDLLSKKVTYLAVALLALMGVVFLVYTSRTGNGGEVSALELQFRQLLDTVLGVRPRTKEFLIGHPIMLTLLYFGYKEKYIPFLILGIIGQISLVNTYAHIHTPILISLIRTGYGLAFGILGGIVLIQIVKIFLKVVRQWQLKNGL